MKDQKKDSMKGQVSSPSNREETISNSGGMPQTRSADWVLDNNEPPDRPAKDSTTGIGKP